MTDLERLRTALEEIAALEWDAWAENPMSTEFDQAQDIARTALAKERDQVWGKLESELRRCADEGIPEEAGSMGEPVRASLGRGGSIRPASSSGR